jgi:putative Holliday junction resolvase
VPYQELPSRGRILAIDFGTVRHGLAISDPGQSFASPYENYTRRSQKLDGDFFRRVVAEEDVVFLVVGLPIHLSGEESRKSLEAREFGDWLGQLTGLPVVLFDERFTTHEAEQHLLAAGLTKAKRRERLDMLAAQALLKGFLDSDRGARQDPPRSIG